MTEKRVPKLKNSPLGFAMSGLENQVRSLPNSDEETQAAKALLQSIESGNPILLLFVYSSPKTLEFCAPIPDIRVTPTGGIGERANIISECCMCDTNLANVAESVGFVAKSVPTNKHYYSSAIIVGRAPFKKYEGYELTIGWLNKEKADQITPGLTEYLHAMEGVS